MNCRRWKGPLRPIPKTNLLGRDLMEAVNEVKITPIVNGTLGTVANVQQTDPK